MSTRLFHRAWTIQVDTLDVSNLDFEFEVLATLKPEPNKASLTLYNLNQDHRQQLLKRNRPNPNSNKLVGVSAQIEAGYIDNTSVIFSGDLNEVGGQRQLVDRKLTLTGQDGGRAYREAQVDVTFAKQTPISSVLQQLASALGVGLGNAANFEAGAQIAGLGSTLPAQMTFSGNAARALTRLLSSMNLTWSIQRGALQVLQKGKPLDLGAIKLSVDSGLVGSPEAAIDSTVSLGNPQQFAPGAAGAPVKAPKAKPKDPSILKVVSLLIPGLVPGRKIDIESEDYSGGYAVQECRYRGQSWSAIWHCEMIVRKY
jgi:hypothetical protein